MLIACGARRAGAQTAGDSLTIRHVTGSITIMLPATWVPLSDTLRARIRNVTDTAFEHTTDSLLQASLRLGRPMTLLFEKPPGLTDVSANFNVAPSPGATRLAFEEATPEQIRIALAPVCSSIRELMQHLGASVITCDAAAVVDRETGRTIAVTRVIRSGQRGFVSVWIAQYADAGVIYTLTLGAPRDDEQRYEPLFRTIWRSVRIQ